MANEKQAPETTTNARNRMTLEQVEALIKKETPKDKTGKREYYQELAKLDESLTSRLDNLAKSYERLKGFKEACGKKLDELF